MKKSIQAITFLFFILFGLPYQTLGGEEDTRGFEEGIDGLASSLMKEIATRYYHQKKRPLIKVAIFDFCDEKGNITVGSKYVSTRMRLAFGRSPQFNLLPLSEFEKSFIIDANTFNNDNQVRKKVVSDMKSDLYIFGKIRTADRSHLICHCVLWGVAPHSEDHKKLGLLIDRLELPWKLRLTRSGLSFFMQVLREREKASDEVSRSKILAEVVFLTQPMCDDLNTSWKVKADGMVYDMRKDTEPKSSLRYRGGQVMESRMKDPEALKGLSYVIKSFDLVIKEDRGKAIDLETYIVPPQSDYFFVPYRKGENESGLRFRYIWSNAGRSAKPAPWDAEKGWKFNMAGADLSDWSIKMPLGEHIGTATLKPVSETTYGTKRPQSDYIIRFKFLVRPGLNTYVVNYVYRRNRPEIFVRRLELDGAEDKSAGGIKKVIEVYKVYGLE